MDNLTSLKADIASGLCTLIQTYNGGLGYVLQCNGLIMHVEFDKDKNTVLEFDVRDKNSGIEHFLELHQDKYHFNHVKVTGETTIHFVYVKPVDMRPWMVKTINASLDELVWCIHRQFESDPHRLGTFFKSIGKIDGTGFYVRKLEEENYIKVTKDVIYSKPNTVLAHEFFMSTAARS